MATCAARSARAGAAASSGTASGAGFGTKADVIADSQGRAIGFSGRVLPGSTDEEQVRCPAWIYVNRHRVEQLWARLKEWRAIATRYDKTARSFIGVLCLAATCDWLKR